MPLKLAASFVCMLRIVYLQSKRVPSNVLAYCCNDFRLADMQGL